MGLNDRDWYQLEADEAVSALETDAASGLRQAEAEARLERYGPNILEEHKGPGPLRILLSQFNDFLIWVLLAATVISIFVLNELVDGVAILVIVVINAVLGFVQEYRAENALAALRQLAAPKATVIRDGSPMEMEARALVPGDIIIISVGDHIPADARLLEAVGLRVDEATLTGESGGTGKRVPAIEAGPLALGDQRNMLFAGSVAVSGRGRAVVVATGASSEMGQVAELIQVADVKTPLQLELRDVGAKLGLLALGISAVVFLAGLARGNPPIAMFLVAVSLAVAAIPESLPAVVTISLALGVQLMARSNAIIRKLHAVETLGATTFICTDKTGTLTRNQMTVVRLFAAGELIDMEKADVEGEVRDEVLRWAGRVSLLCNDAVEAPDGTLIGDPTETALLAAADKMGVEPDTAERLYELPFDSERKRMSTINRLQGRAWVLSKGASEVILPRCTKELTAEGVDEFTDADRRRMETTAAELAGQGYRTLALAFREATEAEIDAPAEQVERDLTFIAIVAMVDPPRPEVIAAIQAAKDARIRVAMVTGDHLLTAKTIASQIGLDWGRALSVADLDATSDEELAGEVEGVSVYARVNPAHKLRIVNALKRNDEIVAMTGDGVNDAPAVKRADIGVAMGLIGTDVTRQAADMILADDNFATIVAAIREGRRIFDNIRKAILFLLSCNASEVLIMLVGLLFVAEPALLPLQILWINLITDGLPALALGTDPASTLIMKRPPRSPKERILAPARLLQAGWQGALIMIGGIIAFAGGLSLGHGVPAARTMVFSAMVLTQLLHSLNFRSEWRTVFSVSTLANRNLLLAIGGSLVLQGLVVYLPPLQRVFDTMPLDATELGIVAAASIIPILLIDRVKVTYSSRLLPGNEREA
ncbi:MAG: cation-translocating P-type ATPase [Actinobacteria bacterium]|nr:MAG: cation-translocating P-type ATPase [Actinomycetota bacterium]